MQYIIGFRNTALVVVILEAIILIGLFYGFFLMRVKRDRAAHEKNQILWVFVNLILILFAMGISFNNQATARILSPLLIAHAIVGTLAELLGIYLILRMKNWVPQTIRIKKYKGLMQITLALWTLQALGGFYIYYSQYAEGFVARTLTPNAAPAPTVAIPPGAVVVEMKDSTYKPKILKIKKGTTVTFIGLDDEKHSVTADDGKFESDVIKPGGSFTLTFSEVGTFPYYCAYHGDKGNVDMAGTIIVE